VNLLRSKTAGIEQIFAVPRSILSHSPADRTECSWVRQKGLNVSRSRSANRSHRGHPRVPPGTSNAHHLTNTSRKVRQLYDWLVRPMESALYPARHRHASSSCRWRLADDPLAALHDGQISSSTATPSP